jgi:hypothetical protein
LIDYIESEGEGEEGDGEVHHCWVDGFAVTVSVWVD